MFRQTRYDSDRLYLRILKPKNAAEVLDYYKRNHSFLNEWEPRRTRDFYTLSYQKKKLFTEYDMFKDKRLVRFWIVKKDDNKLIGNVCYSNIIMGNFKSCFLGYKLDKDEINNGYMTEAIERTVQIMFDDFELHRIEANVVPRNLRSLKVMEKLNFEREGFSKRYLEINGKWEDHIHFAVYND
ncbi:GNAT family N-acetyltransferase [Sedimentibacter hydroxybenzoicus DSM 7310]|uniref:GNAT family N-acetyltransferase n=1 Tax=Sedimentibacter hydroxybenzoicus DSM 7310 TaxID=1123245 RepID=A0A974BK78_SEDHY|nr:GNAT family N-acetyltransferase [Sedimentibacter hydroxybenzoicus]NYB74704.1 GNAT family N-acetyltransferase [Sedimentibacter hydroxybenzoicus DSM 7310]